MSEMENVGEKIAE